MSAIDDAQDAAALLCLGDDDLDGVGGGEEDAADLGDHLDLVEHVNRIEAFAEHQDKRVPGGKREGILLGQLDQRLVCSR